MLERADDISVLLLKYIKNELSAEDKEQLDAWINESEANRLLFEDVTNEETFNREFIEFSRLWEQFEKNQLPPYVLPMPKKRRYGYWYMAAASVILISAIGVYVFFNQGVKETVSKTTNTVQSYANDIAPGENKATLTLADGRKIILDTAAMGKLAQQGNTAVLNKEGQVVYSGAKLKEKEVLYNTLSTAKGQSYSVVLADGTKIWLNAASSVHFPLSFPGIDRVVEISGEAFFEVARSGEKKPFKVKVNGLEIEVLGTVFNVNAYAGEKGITTTLVEGKVRLSKGKATSVMEPGEQAELVETGDIKIKSNADIDKAVAWKNGLFVFRGDDVQTIMAQLSRWYDLQVVYKGKVKGEFYGVINRNQPLSLVLEVLQQSDVHFQVENRTIIVTP
jgi:transmembrane sensor